MQERSRGGDVVVDAGQRDVPLAGGGHELGCCGRLDFRRHLRHLHPDCLAGGEVVEAGGDRAPFRLRQRGRRLGGHPDLERHVLEQLGADDLRAQGGGVVDDGRRRSRGHDFARGLRGREQRATEVVFDNPTGLEIFTWMQSMVDDGLAVTNSASGTNSYNNLLGIRSKDVGMTIDTSAALGTIEQVFASGEGGGVEVGVGPMPGPAGNGGVLVGGAAIYVMLALGYDAIHQAGKIACHGFDS